MPKNRISKQILYNVEWKESIILSHFNFDLRKYWKNKDDWYKYALIIININKWNGRGIINL